MAALKFYCVSAHLVGWADIAQALKTATSKWPDKGERDERESMQRMRHRRRSGHHH